MFWGIVTAPWNPELHSLCRSPVYPHTNVCLLTLHPTTTLSLTAAPAPSMVLQALPCGKFSLSRLPISTPPICLDDCSFFHFLVVGLAYIWVFWQVWLFFVFKFVVFLILDLWGGKVDVPKTPSWPEGLLAKFFIIYPNNQGRWWFKWTLTELSLS